MEETCSIYDLSLRRYLAMAVAKKLPELVGEEYGSAACLYFLTMEFFGNTIPTKHLRYGRESEGTVSMIGDHATARWMALSLPSAFAIVATICQVNDHVAFGVRDHSLIVLWVVFAVHTLLRVWSRHSPFLIVHQDRKRQFELESE